MRERLSEREEEFGNLEKVGGGLRSTHVHRRE